jgi:hypothetical protein
MPPIDGKCLILLFSGQGIECWVRLGDGPRGGLQEAAKEDMQLARSASKATSGGLREGQ